MLAVEGFEARGSARADTDSANPRKKIRPLLVPGAQGAPPVSVQRGAQELVEAALNPRNLCRMDPTWHPWF